MSGIADAPVYKVDRLPVRERAALDFLDHGFTINADVDAMFDIVATTLSAQEAFLFFIPRADVRDGRWSLFNLHVVHDYDGSVEDFAHSRGESVRDIALSPAPIFGRPGIGYDRMIKIADLFKGGEPVIEFIGADPAWLVRDSHRYFRHGKACCYSGMLHDAGADGHAYDALRNELFAGVRFDDSMGKGS